MSISLHPRHLKRYSALAKLLIKYGRSDVVRQAGLEKTLVEEDQAGDHGKAPTDLPIPAEALELAEDLEKLGPTFIKLGQLLSTRSDIMPPAYMEALARLQDKIGPFPFAEVEQIVTSELGVRLSKAFQEFEEEPLAAASLGQVHRAVLRNGRVVAVKVQRPGIREQIADDLDALDDLAQIVDKHTEAGHQMQFAGMLEEFRRSLTRELDYNMEAEHLRTFRRNLAQFEMIIVPEPVEDYTTSRILTMDYVTGRKITDLSPLVKLEMRGDELGEQLFKAYLKQILVDGVFHADPHPGNVFLTQDRKLALIDLGMVGRIAPVMQENLLKLLLAVSEGKGEETAEIAIGIGEITEDFDRQTYTREVSQLVAQHQTTTIEQFDTGRVVLEITRSAGTNGLRLPAELTMLGKTLLNLDMVARILSPDFDPNEAVRRNASDLLRQRMLKMVSPANLIGTVLEMNDLVQKFPGRMNKILDRIADDQLTIRVNAIDEDRVMAGMQKIANRITLGLVLAALIIGSTMLMRVETTWRIFGYPALAMLFFSAASLGGGVLFWNILFKDDHPDSK
ncbi:MAG TPA: AarF/UbiB family protein [Longimicrobiales bacterium]|nr:AarF/UbiB family protein [Longimicrobiales bacterium]